jgi:hypothetical protein
MCGVGSGRTRDTHGAGGETHIPCVMPYFSASAAPRASNTARVALRHATHTQRRLTRPHRREDSTAPTDTTLVAATRWTHSPYVYTLGNAKDAARHGEAVAEVDGRTT